MNKNITPKKMSTEKFGSASLSIIATAVLVHGLIYFADLLTPLALAIFLWLMIDGFADLIHKKVPKIPRKLALPIVFVLVFTGLAGLVAFVADYASAFAKDISLYNNRINDVIAQIYAMMHINVPAPTLGQLFGKINPGSLLNQVGEVLKGFGGEALFVVIYVLCLFAMQSSLPKKIIYIFKDKEERDRVVGLSAKIRKSMEDYLWVQTVTGIMLSVACYVVFLIFGLKNAMFWAMVTFLLSYIPALGGALASVFPALFALVQFATPIPALLILAITQGIQFVVGNIIQPRMTGDSLNLSILMVFLSLAFWGKIWGGAGMFLAVPLTVMIMIVFSQFKQTRAIAIFMSANGKPDGETAAAADKTS
jgi:predicted PurR-regulated permease PerM